MYHVLLTNRYLTTRVIPLIAVAAVALCVALVIIVVSVMTGFLDMVRNSGRTLIGDVVVSYPISGIPYYERLLDRLEAHPNVFAASPLVEGWGLLRMPYPAGPRKETQTIQFWAVEPASFAKVTGFSESLYWRPSSEQEMAEMSPDDFRLSLLKELGREGLARTESQGLTLQHRPAEGDPMPGAVLGIHVSIGNERQKDGSYRPVLGPVGYWWMPRFEVILTVLPMDVTASPQPESAVLRVVNEFVSGVFLIDDKRIIIPLEVGQKLTHLDAAPIVDDEGEETGFIDPARSTTVLVRAVEGVTSDELRDVVADIYSNFRADLARDETLPPMVRIPAEGPVQIQTWLQQQAQFIAPVEKERELMRILFSIIYLVCAGLVLAIFWAIVYEKTRDIGILRSVGASRGGIAMIFLRYGLVIGFVGALVGLGLAYLVVHNINFIHTAMGQAAPPWLWISLYCLSGLAALMCIWRMRRGFLLPVGIWALVAHVLAGLGVALMLHRGTLIWDPSVYYFTDIPNELDPVTAATTMIGAVIFSVLGAFFPAAKAADTDPVKALRYE